MADHIDVLDQEESLKGAFLRSLAVHGVLAAVMVATALLTGHGATNPFGDPSPGGGAGSAVTVTAATIPIPSLSRRVDPIARDTQSQVPERPDKRTVRERPDDDAEGLSKKKKKPTLDMAEYARRRAVDRELEENQLTSTTGSRASSPIYQMQGGGQIGVGANTALGGRFGAYVELVQRCVGTKWREQNIDHRTRTGQPTVVQFVIERSGVIRDAQISQASGNLAVDRASQRAILDCSPLPPLPAAFEKSSASIEFWFQIQK
ncbi:MAG: TonB family protein [Acidobacteria bacterium]|nr:TonB family protein [Acidobacteriota bacterium]